MLPLSKLDDIDSYSLHIVHGYIHDIEKQNISEYPIPRNIVDICLLFYYRYYLQINDVNPTPFTLLFAIYNAKQLLHSQFTEIDLKKLDFSQQINCLNFEIKIDYLITINNKVLSKQIQDIQSHYNTKTKLLLKENDITQWTMYDLILSFFHFLANNKMHQPQTWKFAMYFRKYCHDLNYHGTEFLMDYKLGLDINYEIHVIKGYGLRIMKKICTKYLLKSGPFSKAKKKLNAWAQIIFKQHTKGAISAKTNIVKQQYQLKHKNVVPLNINYQVSAVNQWPEIKRQKMKIGKDCSLIKNEKDELVVYGFINANIRAHGFSVMDQSVYYKCLQFYQQCFTKLNGRIATPFTILFAVFNMGLPLKCTGWDACVSSKQCEYLVRNENTARAIMENEYDFDDIDSNVTAQIFVSIKNMLVMYHNEVGVTTHKHIREWSYYNIIVSFIWYYVSCAVQPNESEKENGWEFIDCFRRYLYDTEYDGDMLWECFMDFKCKNGTPLIKAVCWEQEIPCSKYEEMASCLDKWSKQIYIEFYGRMNNECEPFAEGTRIMSTGQQFIYKSDENRVAVNSLLIYGYTRLTEEEYLSKTHNFIPMDIKQIIEQFYGKTYNVFGDPPSENSFDYAVEFLLPMAKIGINLNKTETKITNCSSEFAQKNIIPNSEIIQINNTYVKNQNLTVEQNDTLWVNLKQKGNSFVVLRAEKELNKTGTHLMFDIRMNNEGKAEESERFPFEKFDINSTLALFEDIWGNNKIEIFDILSNKSCLSGGSGISLLLFVDETNVNLSKYKELKLNNKLRTCVGRRFCITLSYKMNGLKGYGINTSWSSIQHEYWNINTKSLSSLIYLVKGVDDSRNAWYYILVEMDKLKPFLIALKDDIIHLEQYGKILYSAYGVDAPQQITDTLKTVWKID